VLTVAVLAPGQAAAGPAERRAVADGAAWIERVPEAAMPGGQQADAIVALRAAGRPNLALRARVRRLAAIAPRYAVTAGAAAKVVLATRAVGTSPRRFAGVDYVARIEGRRRGGRYGATAYDQALAIIALRAVGRPVPRSAIAALRADRSGPAWNAVLQRRSAPEVDTTSLVVVALRRAGLGARDPMVRGAMTWIARQRNRSGGYASAGGGRPTEANATATTIAALRTAGRTPPAATLRALRGLQRPDGAFRWRAGAAGSLLLATLDAVPALAGVSPGFRGPE
jgi:hypothetical protein